MKQKKADFSNLEYEIPAPEITFIDSVNDVIKVSGIAMKKNNYARFHINYEEYENTRCWIAFTCKDTKFEEIYRFDSQLDDVGVSLYEIRINYLDIIMYAMFTDLRMVAI